MPCGPGRSTAPGPLLTYNGGLYYPHFTGEQAEAQGPGMETFAHKRHLVTL